MARKGRTLAAAVFCFGLLHAQAPIILQPSQPVNSRMAGGESRSYQINLEAGQYLEAVVEQKGIDVVVRVFDPAGKKLLEIDSPNGANGPESVCLIAQSSGPHRIEIAAGDAAAKPGDYQVSLPRLADPSQKDQVCAEADLAYSAAGLLRVQSGSDAQQRSRDAYEKAAGLFASAGMSREEVYALVQAVDVAGKLGDLPSSIALRERLLARPRQFLDRRVEGMARHLLAADYAHLNQYSKAIGYYQQALAIWREVKDRDAEGKALSGIGSAYSNLGQRDKAIDYDQQALAIAREAGDRQSEAIRLGNMGVAYAESGRHEQALDAYQQELAIWRELKDRRDEGLTLNSIGHSYRNLEQDEKAIDYYAQALAIARELKDRRSEGIRLGNMGVTFGELSQHEKALEYEQQALVIAREVNDRPSQAATLTSIGAEYEALGQSGNAMAALDQALPIRREVKDRPGEGQTLHNLGLAYDDVGQTEKAIDYYQQALAIWREGNVRSSEGQTLNNLGSAYGHLGQYQKAIEYLQEALAVQREVKSRRGEGVTLGNLGANYNNLGQYAKGIDYYQQALVIAREVKNRNSEGTELHNLGATYAALRQFNQALSYLEQALAIHREVGDRGGESSTLHALGVLYGDLGQSAKGLEYHERALTILRETRDRTGEGQSLHAIGESYMLIGQYQRAVEYLSDALVIEREVEDRRFEAASLESLLACGRKLNQPRLAIFYGKQAINVIQSIRAGIGGLEKGLQEGYAKTKGGTYRELADLLITQGRLPEAQQVLNLLKEEEYFQFVRRDKQDASALSGRADFTSDEADWAKRYRDVSDRLVAIGARYGELRALKSRTPEEQTELTRLENDLMAGSRAFRQFLGGLNDHFATKVSPSGNVGLAELRDAQALQRTLRQLQHGAVAIYTLTGEDKYRAILVTSALERSYEYPIKAADLSRKIQAFRQLVQNPRSDPRPIAEELYHILVPPALAADLVQANAETLMWYLDGPLRYLPLAALYDGKSYLVERYRLAVFTPASKPELKDEPARNGWKLLGLGVTKAHEDFAALPNVARELSGIVRASSDEKLLDESFTSAAMRSQLDQGYPLVHIATHFRFQAGDDTQSYLLLGDGSHLSVADAKDIPELFRGVELLTLSACNTGVGDSAGDGSEVEGFGVVAQREGAKAVIATLWPVADESTSLFMQDFYRRLESATPALKAEALRQAQLALLHGEVKPGGASDARGVKAAQVASIDFTHPYYWAPFFLMGNWL